MHDDVLLVRINGPAGDECFVVAMDAAWRPEYVDVVVAAGGGAPSVTVSRGVERTRGPDGVVEVLIAVGTWAVTSTAWDVTKMLGSAVGRRIRGRAAPPSLTEADAVECARWVIAQRHGADSAGLVPDIIDVRADGTAEVVLTGDTGWEFTCHVESTADEVRLVRLRRRRFR